MKIDINSKKIAISFPYDKEKVALCQALSMKWNKFNKVWTAENNYMNRVCLNRCFPGILPPEPSTGVKELTVPGFLMDHQKSALRTGAKKDRWGFFHDTGCGKTLTSLEIFLHHNIKTLIICPLSLIDGAWQEELRNWDRYGDIDAGNLWAAKKRSPAALSKALGKDLCIINYESFRTMDKRLAAAGFGACVLDESARIRTWKKNNTSDRVINFCDNMKYVYLLSGVPAPNNMLEYWAQIRILDPLLWGTNLYKFRTKYFYPTGYGGYTYLVKPEYKEQLMRDIKTVAEYVDKEDVLDLPGITESKRIFQLSKEEMGHYRDIKTSLVTILESGEAITSPSAVTAIQKLRQISSGFLLDTTYAEVDGKNKKNQVVHRIADTKLNELLALLEDIGKKQVIIWIEFCEEAVMVQEALNKKGWTNGILNGTVSEKEKQVTLKAFKRGNLQYTICHPKSVGYGHTLVNCTEAVYYSNSYSYDNAKQSKDRIYRKGQEQHCFYYYLLAAKTIDPVILSAVQSKKSSSMAILDYLKK